MAPWKAGLIGAAVGGGGFAALIGMFALSHWLFGPIGIFLVVCIAVGGALGATYARVEYGRR